MAAPASTPPAIAQDRTTRLASSSPASDNSSTASQGGVSLTVPQGSDHSHNTASNSTSRAHGDAGVVANPAERAATSHSGAHTGLDTLPSEGATSYQSSSLESISPFSLDEPAEESATGSNGSHGNRSTSFQSQVAHTYPLSTPATASSLLTALNSHFASQSLADPADTHPASRTNATHNDQHSHAEEQLLTPDPSSQDPAANASASNAVAHQTEQTDFQQQVNQNEWSNYWREPQTLTQLFARLHIPTSPATLEITRARVIELALGHMFSTYSNLYPFDTQWAAGSDQFDEVALSVEFYASFGHILWVEAPEAVLHDTVEARLQALQDLFAGLRTRNFRRGGNRKSPFELLHLLLMDRTGASADEATWEAHEALRTLSVMQDREGNTRSEDDTRAAREAAEILLGGQARQGNASGSTANTTTTSTDVPSTEIDNNDTASINTTDTDATLTADVNIASVPEDYRVINNSNLYTLFWALHIFDDQYNGHAEAIFRRFMSQLIFDMIDELDDAAAPRLRPSILPPWPVIKSHIAWELTVDEHAMLLWPTIWRDPGDLDNRRRLLRRYVGVLISLPLRRNPSQNARQLYDQLLQCRTDQPEATGEASQHGEGDHQDVSADFESTLVGSPRASSTGDAFEDLSDSDQGGFSDFDDDDANTLAHTSNSTTQSDPTFRCAILDNDDQVCGLRFSTQADLMFHLISGHGFDADISREWANNRTFTR